MEVGCLGDCLAWVGGDICSAGMGSGATVSYGRRIPP